MRNRTKRRMFLFDSKEATVLASAASPRTMRFRLKWQPRLRRLLPVTTKSDRRSSLPSRRRRAHTVEARGNKRRSTVVYTRLED